MQAEKLKVEMMVDPGQERNSRSADGFGRRDGRKSCCLKVCSEDIRRPGNGAKYLGNECIELVTLVSFVLSSEIDEQVKLGFLFITHSTFKLKRDNSSQILWVQLNQKF